MSISCLASVFFELYGLQIVMLWKCCGLDGTSSAARVWIACHKAFPRSRCSTDCAALAVAAVHIRHVGLTSCLATKILASGIRRWDLPVCAGAAGVVVVGVRIVSVG